MPSIIIRRAVAGLLLVALFSAGQARASEAELVEIYRDCRLADITVIIKPGTLDPAQSAEVKARASTAIHRDVQGALPRVVRMLKQNGIQDVRITRQGFGGCEPNTSGKFVEAIGTYCGPDLTHAELFVDRQSVMSVDGPETTFEAFLKEGVRKLKEQGIYDRPIVSIENAPDCEASQ
jgi:hypothetical protein